MHSFETFLRCLRQLQYRVTQVKSLHHRRRSCPPERWRRDCHRHTATFCAQDARCKGRVSCWNFGDRYLCCFVLGPVVALDRLPHLFRLQSSCQALLWESSWAHVGLMFGLGWAHVPPILSKSCPPKSVRSSGLEKTLPSQVKLWHRDLCRSFAGHEVCHKPADTRELGTPILQYLAETWAQ